MKHILIKGNKNIFMFDLFQQRFNIFMGSRYEGYSSSTLYEIKTLTNFTLLSFDTKEKMEKAYNMIWSSILAQKASDVIVIDTDSIAERVNQGESA